MPESETKTRICQACGQDCTGQPRIKDSKGRYLHKACYEKARAKAERRKPVEVAARPAPEPDDLYALDGAGLGLGDDLLADIPEAAGGPACPDCGSPSKSGAVLCTICGHNFQTGKSAGKVKVSKETAMGNATVAAASHSAAWTLALIGASIGGIVGAFAWAMVGVMFGLEVGYLAIGVGFLCGLGAALGARSKAGLISGLVASGVAILAIAVGKFAVMQVAIENATTQVQSTMQSQAADPNQPWYTDEELLLELVMNDTIERESNGERLLWPRRRSWNNADSFNDFPSSVRTPIRLRWERMSAEEREALKNDTMRDNMVASIADDIAVERMDAGESLAWPAGMNYEEAFTIEHYPPDVAKEAGTRWDSMPREEQVAYRNAQIEEVLAIINNPDNAADIMAAGYDGRDLFFDILWGILAVGAAFGTGANVARTDTGF